MTDLRDWGGEVFASLLPLVMGAFAIYIMDAGSWWTSVIRWVAEGTLMPPAALLTLVLMQRASRLKPVWARSLAERYLIVYCIAAVMLFTGSIASGDQGQVRSATHWAVLNGVAYGGVVATCIAWAFGARRSSAA